ncbi:MAG: galactose-phosphate uridylyltransferase [Frankiales bacterium]|nr:galactose-phosphate uridylyltransferase [Frankiales bacterium]
MRVTPTTLVDGRTLIYFDGDGAPARTAVDERDLPEVIINSTMRYDEALDEWITFASHRQTRTFLPPADQCPLCPTTDDRQTEVPDSDYEVVVFENRFPSLAGDVPIDPEADSTPFRVRPGNGACEVVCYTSDHDCSFADLTPERARLVLEAWIHRTAELSALPAVEQVFIFENRGESIGVTLHHPHGQIYAYPYVTPRTQRTLQSARGHYDATARNMFSDLLEAERNSDRVVVTNEHWTAFVPFAARMPIEIHVYPHRQVADVTELDEAERASFGPVYLEVLRRMHGVYDMEIPYIAAWHQAPVRIDRELGYLHLEITSPQRAPGKLKFLAGSEAAMGAFINDVLPEVTADALRQVQL